MGSWNDLTLSGDPTGNYQPKGYVVEYGGLPEKYHFKQAPNYNGQYY
jgi:hypothetical protein